MKIAFLPNRKDKKQLKQIDVSLNRNSWINISGYLSIFIIVATAGGMYRDFSGLTLFLGGSFTLLALIRILMGLRFASLYVKGPGRWRNLFYLTAFLQAAIWSVFVVLLIGYYGIHFNTLVALLFTLAITSLNLMASPVFYRVNRIFTVVFAFPPIVAFLVQGQPTTIIVSLLLIIYYLVLTRLAAILYAQYWDRIELRRLVQQKSTDLSQLLENSEKTNTARDKFLSTLTHEVRTPVSSVLGILSLLNDTRLDEVQSEYVSIASRAGGSLLELIDDVLDFAKISTRTLELKSTLFDLHNVIKDCVEALGPVAHEKGIELSYVCAPDLPARVIGDPYRLGQVLTNLVEYIVSKADHGEVVITLNMEIVRADVGLLKVSVFDKNTEFTPEEQASLFYAFSQNDRRKLSRIENTRLGLAISKGLVGCMRGDMGVHSSAEKGCELWFSAEFGLSSQRYEPKKIASVLQNLRIVIIATSEGITQFLSSELKALEAELEFVPDAETAHSLMASSSDRPVDLMLIDMPLDSFDYLDFSASLAEKEETKNIKQIIFSSLLQRGDQRVIDHIESFNSVLFLTKPLRSQNLKDAIHALFEVKQRAAEPDDRIIFSDESKNFRILLVEDDEINQMVVKGMLDKLGYSVFMANDGKEAIEMFARQAFDLVLMDCLMPEMDGYEATEAIRKMEGENRTPIIAITASSEEGEEAHCLASGMDDFLGKPVKLDVLSIKIKHWLGKEAEDAGAGAGVISMDEEKLLASSSETAKNDDIKAHSGSDNKVKMAH